VSQDGLAALRAHVEHDEACAQRLAALPTDAFADEVVQLAAACGFEVTRADLETALAEAARAWHLRWTT
jgi:hypothetical protein